MKPLSALVTGAASGIGKATACKLASRGITLMLADMNRELGLATTVELRKRFSIQAEFQHLDVTQETEVKDLVRDAAAMTGRLDYAANCAGIAEAVAHEEDSITTAWFEKRECLTALRASRILIVL
jgi:NAD(P)-dependent dehydrogenase (short-subunit alcohol dehydrogenase family)